jgi:hypothetical protein
MTQTKTPNLSPKAKERFEDLYGKFMAYMQASPEQCWMNWPIGQTYMASGGPQKAIEEYAKSIGKPTLETFVDLAKEKGYLSPADHTWLSREVKGF